MKDIKSITIFLLIIIPSIILTFNNCLNNGGSQDINKINDTNIPQPTPAGPAGTVWISPSDQDVLIGSDFTTQLFLNSGTQKLGAYSFEINYNPVYISVDTTASGTINGVAAGPDGFLIAVNTETPGKLLFNGFDASGKGPGSCMNLLTIYWNSLTDGSSDLVLTIKTLVDENISPIAIPNPLNGHVIVN